ncbi:MAG: O-antigen ligase domain-containing protein [Bacteroidetes bacterium]|nr:MAG: O-antigen ligase domain-containing protein [Bacteroidota bacterium]
MFESLKEKTGAAKLQHPIVVAGIVFLSVIFSYAIAKGGLMIAFALIGLLFGLVYFNRLFNNPSLGIITLLVFSFVAIGLTRYIRGVPLGLGIDGLLVISFIAIFFKNFYKNISFSQINRDITYLLFFWMAYAMLEFFNPQALSKTAWFYAMRGMSLYPILLVPLGLMLFNRLRFLYLFLYIWGVFTILGTLKGLMQLYIGLDAGEQFWIDTVGGITHLINGELRVFSFFSDAGQFGAAQGAGGIVGLLVAGSIKGRGNRIFFLIMGIMGIWGMMLSGTRGAIIVPMIGGLVYLILRKNLRILIIGSGVLIFMYLFFAFTWLGESNYQVSRMRSAFRPSQDASYQVRLDNRAILKVYLADKPFGGGIGSAGNWGMRFSPQGFLANVATDSWYVQIWAEQGMVGLIIHLFILSFILLKGFYLVMVRVKNVELRGVLGALIAGYAGVMGASYGNGVLGQMPTGALVYLSWAFVFMAQQFDREYSYLISIGKSPQSLFIKD